jgi:hypothetical protein
MSVVIPEATKSKTKINLNPKPNPPNSCLVRYAQVVVFGFESQLKLVVVGVGALGCPVIILRVDWL